MDNDLGNTSVGGTHALSPTEREFDEATSFFTAIFHPNLDVRGQVTGQVTDQFNGQVTGKVATEVIKMLNSISGEMTQSYLNLLSAQTALSSHINLNL